MLYDWQQRQLSRTRTIIFRRYDTLPTSKSRRWPGNPNGRPKFRNLRLFTLARSQLTLRRRVHGWRRLLERHIADVKHIVGDDPGNSNGRSKFHNLFVYFSKIATNAPAAAPRLTVASGDRSNGTLLTSKTSPASAQWWSGSIKVPQLQKFMPMRSSKTSRKISFCC